MVTLPEVLHNEHYQARSFTLTLTKKGQMSAKLCLSSTFKLHNFPLNSLSFRIHLFCALKAPSSFALSQTVYLFMLVLLLRFSSCIIFGTHNRLMSSLDLWNKQLNWQKALKANTCKIWWIFLLYDLISNLRVLLIYWTWILAVLRLLALLSRFYLL